MRTTILSLITLLLFITSSPVYAGTIFEWKELNTSSGKWDKKPTEKSLIIEFEDTKVVGGSKLVGINNNIISLTFEYFTPENGGVVGNGFILDINDLQEPTKLIVKFNSDGDAIEFLQTVDHETSQATIWIGGFGSSYEGVMRFRGNLNSQPFNYAISGRRDNNPATSWDYSEVKGRFMKAEPIPEPTITVTSPNGGEELLAGTSDDITWESTGDIESVKIEYSINNGVWTEIAASTENDGSYDWEVPCNPSDECLIRISDIDGDPFDESDEVFSISSVQGDLDGDCDIDWDDFFFFLSAFGKCEGQGGYNADCDYDGDGCITFVDYQMWYGYYIG